MTLDFKGIGMWGFLVLSGIGDGLGLKVESCGFI